MSFEEYLTSKKINSDAFKTAEPLLWQEWNGLFSQMSPASFTAQKLYLINPIRRKYQLKESPAQVSAGLSKSLRPSR
jgi:hypothetical protein